MFPDFISLALGLADLVNHDAQYIDQCILAKVITSLAHHSSVGRASDCSTDIRNQSVLGSIPSGERNLPNWNGCENTFSFFLSVFSQVTRQTVLAIFRGPWQCLLLFFASGLSKWECDVAGWASQSRQPLSSQSYTPWLWWHIQVTGSPACSPGLGPHTGTLTGPGSLSPATWNPELLIL